MIGSRPALFPVWHLAGWTMLHFIWVGSLVAVLAALGRQLLRRAHPDVRYAYALASLTLLAAAPAVIAAVLAAGSFGAEARCAGAGRHMVDGVTRGPVRRNRPAGQSAAERSARTDLPRLLRWADVMVDILPGVWLVGSPLTFIYMAAGLWGRSGSAGAASPYATTHCRLCATAWPTHLESVVMWPSACATAWRPRSCSASRDRSSFFHRR